MMPIPARVLRPGRIRNLLTFHVVCRQMIEGVVNHQTSVRQVSQKRKDREFWKVHCRKIEIGITIKLTDHRYRLCVLYLLTTTIHWFI